ncbi:MAG: FHA domain-containing protein [Planctomycetales bacterium]
MAVSDDLLGRFFQGNPCWEETSCWTFDISTDKTHRILTAMALTPQQKIFKKIVAFNRLLEGPVLDKLVNEIPDPQMAIEYMTRTNRISPTIAKQLSATYRKKIEKYVGKRASKSVLALGFLLSKSVLKSLSSNCNKALKPNGQLLPMNNNMPVALTEEMVLLGRGKYCTVKLNSPSISENHCLLLFKDGYWFVKDFGSANGIKRNGESVSTALLEPKDEFGIAEYRYRINYEAAEGDPPQKIAEFPADSWQMVLGSLKKP